MNDEGFWLLSHAYPIEVVQLIAGLIGLVASVFGTWSAKVDLQVTEPHSTHRFVGRRNLFEESVRLVVHCLFVVNGLVSILYAPPNPGLGSHDERFFQLFVSRGVMTGASFLLMLKSIRDNTDRAKLRGMFESDSAQLLGVVRTKAVDIIETIDKNKVEG